MTPLLAVDNLHLWYDAGNGRVVRAVDGLTFALEQKGEAIGIVGESGSGKSSLALALMRMPPRNTARFDGSVRLQGREISALGDTQFRREIRWQRIAMVFQGVMSALNPVLRVGDQIAEPLLLEKRFDKTAARARVRDLLERVGLSGEFSSRYPHELSGGQRQRVGIAIALALNPDVLILDEPTSALDVSVQAQIMNLLKDLKEDPGISMIFITHDIGLASDLCGRIAVAYAGEHLELGPSERVLVAPHHPYSQLLLASLPRLHSDVPPLPMPGDPPDLSALPKGCRFRPRCPYAWDACHEHPPPIPLPDGGHTRCWLDDRIVAGPRYGIQLSPVARSDG